jgi:hypothetical protein
MKSRVDGSRRGGMRRRVSRAAPRPRLSLPRRPRNLSMPKRPKIDLDGISKTAERVGAYGRRVDEVATAVQHASETAKKGK